MPGGDRCFVKRNNITTDPVDAESKLKYFIDRVLFENVALDALMRVNRRFPSTRDRVAQTLTSALSKSVYTDKSYRVFASPRYVRFMEMEYGVPIAAVPEALGRVKKLIESFDIAPVFPVEVRTSAADDIPLSTAEGRDTGWIAVHRYKAMNYGEYFRGVEAIMNDYDGRPHWGKFHYQTAATLAPRYPQWEQFQQTRNKMDPHGVFLNDYTERVLGPISA